MREQEQQLWKFVNTIFSCAWKAFALHRKNYILLDSRRILCSSIFYISFSDWNYYCKVKYNIFNIQYSIQCSILSTSYTIYLFNYIISTILYCLIRYIRIVLHFLKVLWNLTIPYSPPRFLTWIVYAVTCAYNHNYSVWNSVLKVVYNAMFLSIFISVCNECSSYRN